MIAKVNVIIMRGISGAGKDHWLTRNITNCHKISADLYQVDAKGGYDYKKERATECHNKCLLDFANNLINYKEDGFTKAESITLAVSNTNITAWEIAPYYRLAEAAGYPVKIVEIRCDPYVAAARTQHGVPAVHIGIMHNSLMMERIPQWWKREIYDQDNQIILSFPNQHSNRHG